MTMAARPMGTMEKRKKKTRKQRAIRTKASKMTRRRRRKKKKKSPWRTFWKSSDLRNITESLSTTTSTWRRCRQASQKVTFQSVIWRPWGWNHSVIERNYSVLYTMRSRIRPTILAYS
jgi:hypothetical protein